MYIGKNFAAINRLHCRQINIGDGMLTGIKDGSDIRPTKAQGMPEERWVRQSDSAAKTRGTQITAIHMNEMLANLRHMIKEKLRVGMKIGWIADGCADRMPQLNLMRIKFYIGLLRGYTGTLAVDFAEYIRRD